MQKKSEFKLNKGTPEERAFVVVTDVPENLCEQIGHARASELLASFGIAHWVQSGVKRSFELEHTPGKASAKVLAEAKALREKVEAGMPVSIMDFVPSPRGEGKNIMEFRDKWPKANEAKRISFLRSKGLDESLAAGDVEDVLPVYLEWLESKDDMGL